MIGKGRKSAGNLKMRAVQNLPNPSDDVAFIKYFPEPQKRHRVELSLKYMKGKYAKSQKRGIQFSEYTRIYEITF